MADNVTLPGTGAVVATDDIGGVQYQFMKLVDGTLDSTNKAIVDDKGRLEVDASFSNEYDLLTATAGTSATLKVAGFTSSRLDITQASGVGATFEVSYDSGSTYSTAVLYDDVDCLHIATVTIPAANTIRYVDFTNVTHFRVNNTGGSVTCTVKSVQNTYNLSRGIRPATKTATATMGALNAAVTLNNLDDEWGWIAITSATSVPGGTITCEGSMDNSTWVAISGFSQMPNSGANWSAQASFSNTMGYAASTSYIGHTAGYKHVRLRLSAYTSGSSTIMMRALKVPPFILTPSLQAVTQTTASSLNAQVVGNIASGSADSGNPVKVGGIVTTATETAATAAQRINTRHDKSGRVVVQPFQHVERAIRQQTTLSTTSETTIVTAGGASVFNYITHISLFNSSATTTLFTLKDSTAGTTRAVYLVPAGGGMVIDFSYPLVQATANSNWTGTLSGAVSNVYVNVVGYATA